MNSTPITDDARWMAVAHRDPSADGTFVYAVRTTGIFCRPSCPSRRPRRRSVTFFAGPDAAEAAGYRECRRCRPRSGAAPAPALRLVRLACEYINMHAHEPLTLTELGAHLRTSRFHLHRVFTKLMGLSPKAYHEAVRAGRFRNQLRRGAPVTAALYDAGYGSSSRVYDSRRPTGQGMTPSAYRRGGKGLVVRYLIVDSPVGRLMVAGTEKGICSIKLGDSDDVLERELRREYPQAALAQQPSTCASWVRALLAQLDGRTPNVDLPLDVRATAFQWRVWRVLQSIPWGETRSYSDVAKAIGKRSAVRAVARACATNPVSLIVPCHRVIGKDGSLAGYRWGIQRKQALLDKEAGRNSQDARRGQ